MAHAYRPHRRHPVQARKVKRQEAPGLLDQLGTWIADLCEHTPIGRWAGHLLILTALLLSIAVAARIAGLY